MSKIQKFGKGVKVAKKPLPIGLELSESSPGEWDVSFVLSGAQSGWKTDFEARDYAVECLKALIEAVRVPLEERGARTAISMLFEEAVARGHLHGEFCEMQTGLMMLGWLARKEGGFYEVTDHGQKVLDEIYKRTRYTRKREK